MLFRILYNRTNITILDYLYKQPDKVSKPHVSSRAAIDENPGNDKAGLSISKERPLKQKNDWITE